MPNALSPAPARPRSHPLRISLLSGAALALVAAIAFPGGLGAALALGALGAVVVGVFVRLYRWAFECLTGGSADVDCNDNPRGPTSPTPGAACASC